MKQKTKAPLSPTKKTRRVTLILTCVLLLLGILFGGAVRLSYNRKSLFLEEREKSRLSWPSDKGLPDLMPMEATVQSLKEAPYVCIVTLLSAENVNGSTKSKVQIKKVMQGDQLKEGDTLTVYEPNNFASNNVQRRLYYGNYCAANLMLKGQDYLLFLEEKQYDPDYQKGREKEYVYRKVSTNGSNDPSDPGRDGPSCFRLNYNQTAFFPQDIEQIFYSTLKNEEFICLSKEALDNLNAIKREIFAYYSIPMS